MSSLYPAGVLARLLLAFAQSRNPIVMADEALYFNLARALADSGDLALRGQPVAYASLLYPLLLSPLTLLPPQFDLYRAVQVFNALAMNLAVFPAWLLARRLCAGGSVRFLAAVALLLPDLTMTELAMTESVGYPLTLFAFYLAHRALDEDGLGPVLAAAFCCFLLFLLKPGFAVVGGVLSAALLCRCLTARSAGRENAARAARLCAAGTGSWLALCAGAHVLIRHLWRQNFEIAGVYRNLTDAFLSLGALKGFNALLLYGWYFAAACLVVPVALPPAHLGSLPRRDRLWLGAVFASALLLMSGACFSIYIDEYTGMPFSSRIHLRYAAPYLLLMLIPCFSPHLENKRMNPPLFAILVFCACGLLVFGFDSLRGGKAHPVDSLSLALAQMPATGTDMKILLRFFFLFGLALLGYSLFRNGWTKRTRNAFAACLCLFWTLGNAVGYALLRWNDDIRWAADAREVAARTQGRNVLFVAADGGYFWNPATALDVRLRKPPAVVELDDLVAHTAAGGVYRPFLPRAYWKEKPANRTPGGGWLVMDAQLLHAICLYPSEQVFYSANGLYARIRLESGRTWAHSAISGLKQGWVWGNSRLSIFDARLCSQDSIRVHLHARAGEGTSTLTLSAGENTLSFTLNDSLQWIAADLPVTEKGRPFRVTLSSRGNVLVSTYRVE